MPKGKVLTEKEKGLIEGYRRDKHGIREISRRIRRSHTVVINYLKDPAKYGKTKRTGRPPKLSVRDRRAIIRTASNSSISLRQLKRRLKLNVARETIRQVLVKCPYITYAKKRKAPRLTASHMKKRLEFALSNRDRHWCETIFSDEKKFTLDGPETFNGHWRDSRKEEEFHHTRNYGGGNIMVWAGFTLTGKLKLVFTSNKMTSKDYIEVLDQCLLPFVHEHRPNQFTFQHDNAPIHTSRLTKQWLVDHNIDLLDWPARSPDLNPMENLWGILVRRIYAEGRQYDSVNELKTAINEAWESIENSILENLVHSMPNRLRKVIEAKGNVIHY